ncbi:MAG: 30S ribosomal protein S9 [Bryobacterales bacterium]|nr:30S ribosomal protein S9 [Bryobacterales bacterium]
MPNQTQWLGTGRRKSAIARVFLRPGAGKIRINDQPPEQYFPTESLKAKVRQPLLASETDGKFDALVLVHGGGKAGQADAVRLGVARALQEFNSELRPLLKKGGYLTRDPRKHERKKYGRPGARKRFQYSKR